MDFENWKKWSKTAGQLEKKYDENKLALMDALSKKKTLPVFEYKYKEVLILLYLLKKIVDAQLSLYFRFINGSQQMIEQTDRALRKMPDVDKEVIETMKRLFYEIHIAGMNLSKEIRAEQEILQELGREFDPLENHIDIKDITSGVFHNVDNKMLKEVTRKLIPTLEEEESPKIKQVHDKLLHHLAHEIQLREQVIEKIDSVKGSIKTMASLTTKLGVKKARDFAPAIYFVTCTAFFLGVITEDMLSPITTVLRMLMNN